MNRIDIEPEAWLAQPRLVAETHARLTAEGLLIAAPDVDGKLNR